MSVLNVKFSRLKLNCRNLGDKQIGFQLQNIYLYLIVTCLRNLVMAYSSSGRYLAGIRLLKLNKHSLDKYKYKYNVMLQTGKW